MTRWRLDRGRMPSATGVVAGIVAFVVFNFAMTVASVPLPASPVWGVVLVILNLAVIGIALAKRQRRFAIGFATGYIAVFILLIGPCFQVISGRELFG